MLLKLDIAICLKEWQRCNIQNIAQQHFTLDLIITCLDLRPMKKEDAFALKLALRLRVRLRTCPQAFVLWSKLIIFSAVLLPFGSALRALSKTAEKIINFDQSTKALRQVLRRTRSPQASSQAKASSFVIGPRSKHVITRSNIKCCCAISSI